MSGCLGGLLLPAVGCPAPLPGSSGPPLPAPDGSHRRFSWSIHLICCPTFTSGDSSATPGTGASAGCGACPAAWCSPEGGSGRGSAAAGSAAARKGVPPCRMCCSCSSARCPGGSSWPASSPGAAAAAAAGPAAGIAAGVGAAASVVAPGCAAPCRAPAASGSRSKATAGSAPALKSGPGAALATEGAGAARAPPAAGAAPGASGDDGAAAPPARALWCSPAS